MEFKRITAIAIYSYVDDTNVVELFPNNGEHWKELMKKHSEFKKFDDDLEWVSDDYDKAHRQFLVNDLLVDVEHYDIVNPMTKKKKVTTDEN